MKEQTIEWENYVITVDENSRTLQRKVIAKKGKNAGKERLEVLGHYNKYRMDSLLKNMLHYESLKHGHTFALEEYIALWARLSEKLTEDLDKKFKLA